MNSKSEKKDLFYVIILILTLLVVIVGITFAAYYFLHRQEEGSSAVYTGTLSIEYLSGNIIKVKSMYPREAPELTDTDNIYKNNFRIVNTGSLDSLINVALDITENDFSDEILKYKLFDSSGQEVVQGDVKGTGDISIATNIDFPSNAEVNYSLVIWLNENGENQNEDMKKELAGIIKVDANQKIVKEVS